MNKGIYSEKNKTKNRANGAVQVGRYNVLFPDAKWNLCQLSINALDENFFSADRATLKIDNKKDRWKGVYLYQEHNGYEKFSPVRSLGSRCISIQKI